MKPWLAHYDADVAPSLAPYPDKTLLDYLSRSRRAITATSRPCCSRARRCRTPSSSRRATRLPPRLASLGVRPGDRVALLLPNCPQFMVAQFGIWKAGAIVVALNPIYSERELEVALASTGASLVVALTPFYQRIKTHPGAHAVCGASSPRRSRSTCRPCCDSCSRSSRKRKTAIASRLTPDDLWFQTLLREHRSVATSSCGRASRRPGGDPLERRHDGNAEGRRRPASRTTWRRACNCTTGPNRR